MKKTIMLQRLMIVLFYILFTIKPAYGDTTLNELKILDCAIEHVVEHSFLTKEQLSEFNYSIIENKGEEYLYYIVQFYYTELYDTPITVRIDRDGNYSNCDCNFYSLEDYHSDIMYRKVVWPTVVAAQEWETKYGPHELWDVFLNADFYNEYGHIPYESKFAYSHGHAHYDYPNDDSLSPSKATELAKEALMKQVEHIKLKEMSIGSFFCNRTLRPPCYYVNFYMFEDGQWDMRYAISIDAKTGEAYITPY